MQRSSPRRAGLDLLGRATRRLATGTLAAVATLGVAVAVTHPGTTGGHATTTTTGTSGSTGTSGTAGGTSSAGSSGSLTSPTTAPSSSSGGGSVTSGAS